MRHKVVWLLVVLSMVVASCGKSGKNSTFVGHVIPITDSLMHSTIVDTVRFGRLSEGEIAVKQLSIRNETSTPLVVGAHKTTCGCVRLDYKRAPFLAGESLPVEMLFDSRGEYGWQMKLVTLYIGDDATPLKIYIEAEVE